MKITQISAISFEGESDIFGLGDDSKVYYWGNVDGEWHLNVAPSN